MENSAIVVNSEGFSTLAIALFSHLPGMVEFNEKLVLAGPYGTVVYH